jgi:FkbM family methyltransferase
MKKIIVDCIKLFLNISPNWVLLTLPYKFPSLLKFIPKNRKFISNYYLTNLKVNIDTYYRVERQLLLRIYEKDSSYIFKKFIKKGDFCLDIGANIGALSLLMCKLVEPTGKVYSFEPGPKNFSRLLENIKLNPSFLGITQLIQAGVSDKPGKLYWEEESHNPGNARLVKKGNIEVPVITIDHFFSNNPLEKLNFVKIDVETMEHEVLSGGINTWKKYKPILSFESQVEFRVRETEYGQFDL